MPSRPASAVRGMQGAVAASSARAAAVVVAEVVAASGYKRQSRPDTTYALNDPPGVVPSGPAGRCPYRGDRTLATPAPLASAEISTNTTQIDRKRLAESHCESVDRTWRRGQAGRQTGPHAVAHAAT